MKWITRLYRWVRTADCTIYLAAHWNWFNRTFWIIEPDDPEPTAFQSAWFDLQSQQGIAQVPHRWL